MRGAERGEQRQPRIEIGGRGLRVAQRDGAGRDELNEAEAHLGAADGASDAS